MSDTDHRDRTSRRGFLKTIGAAGATAVVSSACAPSAQAPATNAGTDSDLRLVNGRIHTIDGRGTVADSVVIRNGVFAAVGGDRRRRVRRVIDLGGRTVVPGFVEPHIHSVSLANRPGYHTILENTTSIRGRAGSARGAAQRRARRAMDHVDGRLASEPMGRASSPDARRARRSRSRSPRVSVRALHGPVRRQQPRQEILRRCRRS